MHLQNLIIILSLISREQIDETTSFTNIQGTRDEPKAWKGHSAIVGNKATKAIKNIEQGVKNLAGVGEGGLADKAALNALKV